MAPLELPIGEDGQSEDRAAEERPRTLREALSRVASAPVTLSSGVRSRRVPGNSSAVGWPVEVVEGVLEGTSPVLHGTLLLVMGLGTFLIGLLPTYESIGAWAPALLVLARLMQGFAAGGDTPREFLERCLTRLQAFEPTVGAFVCHDIGAARAAKPPCRQK